jgi:hypothetical protein
MKRFSAVLIAVVGLAFASTASFGDTTPQGKVYTIQDVRAYNNARTMGTDYHCLSDCTSHGYLYALCQSKCSFPDPVAPQQQRPPQGFVQHGTDYQCISKCTNQGYQYALCQNRCSY